MKILLTGGGTGGHFYPLIAVAQAIRDRAYERKLLEPELYFSGPTPYSKRLLFENQVGYIYIPGGKLRRYFSLRNAVDMVKTAWGILYALIRVFMLYPDVVFSKGGYASLPTVFAARVLRIPVIIHESDTVPGRANQWAGKFAERIALSYPDAADFFPEAKTAYTGNPIRKDVQRPAQEGAHEFLNLDAETPTILILGGSQGAQKINDAILDVLPDLVEKYQIIHQVGTRNEEDMQNVSAVVLEESEYAHRYKVFGHLNDLALRMSAGAADLAISRAGSTLFELALWGVPAIVVPITESNGDHQRKNAFAYARATGGVVVEEDNLSPHIIMSEVNRLIDDPKLLSEISEQSKEFAKPNAARTIADALLEITVEHEAE